MMAIIDNFIEYVNSISNDNIVLINANKYKNVVKLPFITVSLDDSTLLQVKYSNTETEKFQTNLYSSTITFNSFAKSDVEATNNLKQLMTVLNLNKNEIKKSCDIFALYVNNYSITNFNVFMDNEVKKIKRTTISFNYLEKYYKNCETINDVEITTNED